MGIFNSRHLPGSQGLVFQGEWSPKESSGCFRKDSLTKTSISLASLMLWCFFHCHVLSKSNLPDPIHPRLLFRRLHRILALHRLCQKARCYQHMVRSWHESLSIQRDWICWNSSTKISTSKIPLIQIGLSDSTSKFLLNFVRLTYKKRRRLDHAAVSWCWVKLFDQASYRELEESSPQASLQDGHESAGYQGSIIKPS